MKKVTIIVSRCVWFVFAITCGPAILLGSAIACPTSGRVRGSGRWGFLFAGATYYAVGATAVMTLARRLFARDITA